MEQISGIYLNCPLEQINIYEKFLKEEQDYRDPNYYDIATVEADIHPDVAAAKIINNKPYVGKAFVRVEPLKQPVKKASNKPTRAYTFAITWAEAIFDPLLADTLLKFPFGHKIPPREELKDKEFYK